MGNELIFNEYLQRLEDDGLSKRTLDNNIFILKPFIKWLDGQEITDKTVLAYLRSLKPKNYSDSTLYQYKAVLKKFLSTISPEGARSIKLKVKRKEPPIILSQKEIEQLIEACRNPRDRALISFLYESGCRKGEMVSIKIENVTFTDYGAAVIIPKGKTGSRTIPIVYSASYLRQWLESHPTKGQSDPLFCSLQMPFNQISFSGLEHLFKSLKERTGIKKKIYCHLFRHTRATHMATKYTEQEMKNLLGWKPGSEMAATYVHLSQRDTIDAVLREHGLQVTNPDKDTFKVGKCPRCKEINPEKSLYCGKCGLPLNKEFEYKTDADFKDASAKLIDFNDPDVKAQLMKFLMENQ